MNKKDKNTNLPVKTSSSRSLEKPKKAIEKMELAETSTQQNGSIEEMSKMMMNSSSKESSEGLDLDPKGHLNSPLVKVNNYYKKMTCTRKFVNWFLAPVQTEPRCIELSGKVTPANYAKNIVRNQKYNFFNF